MKKVILIATMTMCASSFAHASNQTQVDSKTLHVDGAFADKSQAVEKKPANDDELKFLQSELNNVKGLKTGYKKKAGVYLKLSEQSEELKEQFEGYLDNRVDYEKAISGYNGLVECLKTGDAKKCTRSGKRNRKGGMNGNQNGNYNESTTTTRTQTNGYSTSSNTRGVRNGQGTSSTYSDSIEIRQAGLKKAGSNQGSRSVKVSRTGKRSSTNNFVRDVDYRVAMRQSDLVRCYRKSNMNDEGVLKIVLKIAPNGNLNHLGFKDTRHINDKNLIRCVSKVLYSIVYPETPNRRIVSVSKPFVFNKI
jgi:hypothetical protein